MSKFFLYQKEYVKKLPNKIFNHTACCLWYVIINVCRILGRGILKKSHQKFTIVKKALKRTLILCKNLAIVIFEFLWIVTRKWKHIVLLAYTYNISCHTRPLTIYYISKFIGYIPLISRALKGVFKPCQNLAIVIFEFLRIYVTRLHLKILHFKAA